MLYLKEIIINKPKDKYHRPNSNFFSTAEDTEDYSSDIEALTNLKNLKFRSPVTFFAGENGSGKSTLLEAIALAYGFNEEGGSRNFNFSTRRTASNYWQHITLSKGAIQPKDSFFLRTDSFFTLASEIDRLFETDRYKVYGGGSLHEQSHGEGILTLVKNRFRGNGLYLLDEPEAALSIQHQLSFLVLMNELVMSNSQFIIVTHSPIILGYPGAQILNFDDGITPVNYEETDSYQLTKMFMNNREDLIKRMFDETI